MVKSEKNDVPVPMTLEELQAAGREMLSFVDGVCESNGFVYYLAFGTLLGAVRHKDLIPWDDDVDIWMPFEDWSKLKSMWQQYQSGPYVMQCYESDQRFQLDLIRFRKRGTCYPTRPSVNCGWKEQGAWIDIYPLYPASSEKKLNRARFNLSLVCNSMAYHRLYNHKVIFGKNCNCSKMVAHYLAMALSRLLSLRTWMKLRRKIRLSTSGCGRDCDSFLCYGLTDYSKMLFKKKWFREGECLPIASGFYSAPAEWDEILTQLYGDYMTPVQRAQALFVPDFRSRKVS